MAHWTGLAAIAALVILSRCGGDEAPRAPGPAVAPRPAAGPDVPLGPRVFPLDAAPALDDPERDLWQRPEQVIEALAIEPGARVADVGCGTGYFTRRLLEAVGPEGFVIAVDVQQGMLDILRDRLNEPDLKRVELRRNAPDRPLAAGDTVDLALCANTLNEVDDADAAAFVRSLAEGLAPGGRLATIDWLPTRTRLGPRLEDRIAPERVRALAEEAGLALVRQFDFLPMHSFLVFRKSP